MLQKNTFIKGATNPFFSFLFKLTLKLSYQKREKKKEDEQEKGSWLSSFYKNNQIVMLLL